ncbi:MAG: Glu/Leu/Phe/Val dehydrogenase [Planctomycetes bacterium]|nr:Glu/Leu/Phe/Val dehydrogenase [Planctomycetota bacterium]MBI3845677.1 Glu/Leu/Phe/Val dehydrogenase [Planctomycetota bacterium]
MDITPLRAPGYEDVRRCRDQASGLHAIIAVHSTVLGPALGGMRVHLYRGEDEALTDVLRLAAGMTFKAALADLPLGGGKAVFIGDPKRHKTESRLLAMGRFVESFGGRYVTAEDVGCEVRDLEILAKETRHVTGLSRESGSSGNPGPATALGVYHGIRACLDEVFGSPDPLGRSVAIQGVGSVGAGVARHLAQAGARLTMSDIEVSKVERVAREVGARVTSPEEIIYEQCDVLAPCALGGILDDHAIPRLRCRIVAGCANNQLLEPRHGDLLAKRDILYAPDYAINSGGIINIASELRPGGFDEKWVQARLQGIADTLRQIFRIAREERIGTHVAADRIVRERLAAGKRATS